MPNACSAALLADRAPAVALPPIAPTRDFDAFGANGERSTAPAAGMMTPAAAAVDLLVAAQNAQGAPLTVAAAAAAPAVAAAASAVAAAAAVPAHERLCSAPPSRLKDPQRLKDHQP